MKIVIATGGSGGHLFPALKTAQELKKDRHEVFFLGSFRVGKNFIEEAGFPYREFYTRGLDSANVGAGLKSIVFFIQAAVEAGRFLRAYAPDVVAGFGGYGAFPVVLAAVFLRYPTLIHEQNVVPGRANKVLSPFVRRITLSFPQTRRYFPGAKTVLTGCPSRTPGEGLDKREALRRFHLQEGWKTILVFGGSQGSHRINAEFMETARRLKREIDFQVIHICGDKDEQRIREDYQRLGIPFAVFTFLDDMESAYKAADMVIARAGAVSVTEIARFRKPAVFIPYPYAGGHQRKNAEVLSSAGLAVLMDEKDLCAEGLQKAVVSMLAHPPEDAAWTKILGQVIFEDAAGRLAGEITVLGKTNFA